MRYYGRLLNAPYTDFCVVLGPNVRWVEDDYEDLNRAYPEVFLGYRVLLTTPRDVRRSVMGRRPPTRVVVVGEEARDAKSRDWNNALNELHDYQSLADYGDMQGWHVHRGTGIWRTW